MKTLATLVLVALVASVPASGAVFVALQTSYATLDLGLPFEVKVFLGNDSETPATNVDVTIDFAPEVGIGALPAGCSSPAAGRVVCRAAQVMKQTAPPAVPAFTLTLIAPATWQSPFSITATTGSSTTFANVALFPTIYVTTTANDGSGSLRAAIDEANVTCRHPTPCKIAFRIDESSANRWKTIRLTSPLPVPLSPRILIDGATQTAFFGDTNPDGPEIEISGGGSVDGDGLTVTTCGQDVGHLALNGFRGNGVSVIPVPPPGTNCLPGLGARLHDLYLGTDPTGTEARPNLRGIGTITLNGTTPVEFHIGATIRNCVISGNLRSGVFGYFGAMELTDSRIGVKAHTNEPLPNGNAGVYAGNLSHASHIGRNVIAFNGHMGVGIAAGIEEVSVTDNRIWSNGGLGIDIGLDGPTPNGAIPAPVLTLARYDPATKQTIIEGDYTGPGSTFGTPIDIYANDQVDPSGYGEGQRPLGVIGVASGTSHFVFAADGNLTGQFITATATRSRYIGLAKPTPAGFGNFFLTQTSEFSRAIEVR